MKRTIYFIIVFCSVLVLPGFAIGIDPPIGSQYEVIVHILSVSTGPAENFVLQSSRTGISGKDAEGFTPLLIDLKQIKLGGYVVEPGPRGELLWNGRPKPPTGSPFHLIGSPSVIAAEGRKFSLIQSDPVEYLEKEDNAYRLKITPPDASPSLTMDCVIESMGGDQVKLDFHLTLSVMTGRKKLASTILDIGEPILKKKAIPLELKTQVGRWLIPTLFVTQQDPAGNKEHLIVLMLVRRLK